MYNRKKYLPETVPELAYLADAVGYFPPPGFVGDIMKPVNQDIVQSIYIEAIDHTNNPFENKSTVVASLGPSYPTLPQDPQSFPDILQSTLQELLELYTHLERQRVTTKEQKEHLEYLTLAFNSSNKLLNWTYHQLWQLFKLIKLFEEAENNKRSTRRCRWWRKCFGHKTLFADSTARTRSMWKRRWNRFSTGISRSLHRVGIQQACTTSADSGLTQPTHQSIEAIELSRIMQMSMQCIQGMRQGSEEIIAAIEQLIGTEYM